MLKRLAIIGAAVLLAACTSVPVPPTARPGATLFVPVGTGGPPVTTNLCDLVTIEEVQAATGRPAQVQVGLGEMHCAWDVGDPSALVPEMVIDFRFDGAGTDLAGPRLAQPGGQDVAGIGDGAYWAPDVKILWFVRGGNTFAVQLVRTSEDNTTALQIAQQIASAALSRM